MRGRNGNHFSSREPGQRRKKINSQARDAAVSAAFVCFGFFCEFHQRSPRDGGISEQTATVLAVLQSGGVKEKKRTE